jgi:Zn-dependent oligopeptidase
VRTTPPGRTALHLLDRISDSVCRATDAAHFCANAHADRAWRAAAGRAHGALNEYLAQLNTQRVLWQVLDETMAGVDAQPDGWTDEERIAGASLLLEFEQAGLGRGEEAGARYREMAGREQALCARLMRFEVRHLMRRSTVQRSCALARINRAKAALSLS